MTEFEARINENELEVQNIVAEMQIEQSKVIAESSDFREELIKEMFPSSSSDLLAYIDSGPGLDHLGVEYLREHPNELANINLIIERAMAIESEDLVNFDDYEFNALEGRDQFSSNPRYMCAYYVSTILGLGDPDGSYGDKFAQVRRLLPQIIRLNHEINGTLGIVEGPGYTNLQRGDVLAYADSDIPEEGGLGHVSIVRDRFSFNTPNGIEEFLCIQHSTTQQGTGFIQIVFVPVDPDGSITSLQEAWETPDYNLPIFNDIAQYRGSLVDRSRRVVFVDQNSSRTTGDMVHHMPIEAGGDVVFALRTASIMQSAYTSLAK